VSIAKGLPLERLTGNPNDYKDGGRLGPLVGRRSKADAPAPPPPPSPVMAAGLPRFDGLHVHPPNPRRRTDQRTVHTARSLGGKRSRQKPTRNSVSVPSVSFLKPPIHSEYINRK